MATVIFDFDSTLISCESLEELLSHATTEKSLQKIKNLTNQGMDGTISFLDSITKRLNMAAFKREDFTKFGKEAIHYLTPGMDGLIAELQSASIDVWIISGAVQETLFPLGEKLGIPQNRIIGVELSWSSEGLYQGIDRNVPINCSKWEGAEQISSSWKAPRIAIGDSMTDFALFQHGLVDNFIAFTEHVRRQKLLNLGVSEARSVLDLQKQLMGLIHA